MYCCCFFVHLGTIVYEKETIMIIMHEVESIEATFINTLTQSIRICQSRGIKTRKHLSNFKKPSIPLPMCSMT